MGRFFLKFFKKLSEMTRHKKTGSRTLGAGLFFAFTEHSQYSRNPLLFLKLCYNSVTVSPYTAKRQFTQTRHKKRYISTLLTAF